MTLGLVAASLGAGGRLVFTDFLIWPEAAASLLTVCLVMGIVISLGFFLSLLDSRFSSDF